MNEGLVPGPKATDQTIPRTDIAPERLNQELGRVVGSLAEVSIRTTGERINRLSPEARLMTSKALALLERVFLSTPIDAKKESSKDEVIKARITLRNLIGNHDELGLNTSHAVLLADFFLEVRANVSKPFELRLPWKQMLEQFFSNVPHDEIARQSGMVGTQVSSAVSTFLAPIRHNYPKSLLKDLLQEKLETAQGSASPSTLD